MPVDDPQTYDPQPRLWQHPQEPFYAYPRTTPVPHEHSSNIALSSYNYAPSYDQISQSSSLVPSSTQYPPPDSAQPPYTPFSRPSTFSGHRQHSHDYLAGSQHDFDPRVSAMTNPSFPANPVSNAYTSSPFPHQLSELGQAPDYSAQVSIPTVTTPDDVAPTFSAFDAPYYHTQTSPASNKRQRSVEQEEDGDTTDQTRGLTLQLSTAEKLKRACTRCRGLKVRLSY